ncbi:MAG: response regulator [Candidatus Hydrogenedentes bacterium]|nr:response regulator [Candidatus Hydrogenedentota bacterium]
MNAKSDLARMRVLTFSAIGVACGLRFAGLLLAEVMPDKNWVPIVLGMAGLTMLALATLYALVRYKSFPRFGYAIVFAIACLSAAQVISGSGATPQIHTPPPDGILTPLEFIRIVLLSAGLALGIIGFYLSIFELLKAREQQHAEQEKLGEALREREHAEEKWRVAESRLRTLFDGMEDALFVHDMEGRILECNTAASARMGYTREELLSMRTQDFDAPEFASGFGERLQEQLRHKRFRCEGVQLTKDQRPMAVDIHTVLIDFRGQQAILAVNRDITERKIADKEREVLQARVAQAEKLESLGVMAGGIAHDFNNLLMGVLGNASLARLDLPAGSPIHGCLEQIESAAQRATSLSQQMLAYSGRATFTKTAVDLCAVVREAQSAAGHAVPAHTRVDYQLDENSPLLEGDAAQLRQVLLNLIVNAAEAYGERAGAVAVSVRPESFTRNTPRPPRLTDAIPDGSYVVLEVVDGGAGIEDQTADRMFDPFFTTKFTGRGLGLAAAVGIVRGHRGAISVVSSPGHGSTFRVYLPVSVAHADGFRHEPARGAAETAKGILVVDDEETVLSVTERALRRAGYTVFSAHNGHDAVELFRTNADAIGLVVLDMTMPRMSGEEACRALRALRENVRVLVSSGYSEAEAAMRFDGDSVDGFLQKPYRAGELVAVVADIIGSPAESTPVRQNDFNI